MNKIQDFENRIGYHFRSPELLLTALRHSSYLNEHGLAKTACNERLEFLGDAVLELLSSEFLFEHFPDSMEGDLSRKRAALVCEAALSEAGKAIGLPGMLLLGHGAEAGGGRENPSIISDAFEALLAAIYLDGGTEAVRNLVHTYVLADIDERLFLTDAKSLLQEAVQKHSGNVSYQLVSESGPDHRKLFTSAVYVNGRKCAEGTAGTKKEAEQIAAGEAIKQMRNGTLCI